MSQHTDKELKEAILDIIWMARRYAHNRSTYAPTLFNDAYDKIVKILGDLGEVPDQVTPFFPYAQDGSYNPETNEFNALPIHVQKRSTENNEEKPKP